MRFSKLICLIVLTFSLLPLSPAAGEVIIVSSVKELMATSGPGQPDGLTVLIKDGEYRLPHRIIVDGRNITYKGLNNDRDKVKLTGEGPRGKVHNIFSIKGQRIYIQHLSLGEVANHGIQIHGENNADHIFLQRLRFYDTKEQMIKGSFDKNRLESHTDFGLIEDCLFEFTSGFAFQSYTGGIDIHRGENWVVKNNRFLNIRTGGQGLTEGAVHFWNNSKNVRILDNIIENCDRGIMLGLDNSSHTTALIQGNRIQTVKDTGIYLCNASDITVQNNKITIASNYPNAIEYRFKGSHDLRIHDNEVNKKIVSRDGGQAEVFSNKITDEVATALPAAAPPRKLSIRKRAIEKLIPASDDTPLPVATGINVFHNRGQSFIVFNETVNPFPSGQIRYAEFFEEKKKYDYIAYNLYRSASPITSILHLKPVAVIKAFSGINPSFYGKGTGGKHKNTPVIRYVIKDKGQPLSSGKGLFVFNPPSAGTFYYAVTSLNGKKENPNIVPGKNTTLEPVAEIVGRGIPVLQRIEHPSEYNYIKNPHLYFYTRWEAPPNSSIPGKPFDYLVGIPPSLKKPAPVGIHLHAWGGNLLQGFAWWTNGLHGSILLSTNQEPYDWWTGYREDFFSDSNSRARIRPYTTNRIFSFLEYMAREGQWEIDLKRTFTAGMSMGGSGSIMAAIRYPEKIAWARSWVGIHKPDLSPQFKGSYERVWGKQSENRLFEDGSPVWQYYDDVAYLKTHPKKEIGFITFSNGKNDSGIGWKQSVLFYRMLQETRRPHLFIWGMQGHDQRTVMPKNNDERFMPIDMATNLSLPAFTRCSLDDDPGDGSPDNGDPKGQINRWLYWETDGLVDNKERWEITVGLMGKAPKQSCRADLTPRRLQAFRVRPGETVYWENKKLSGGILNNGQIKADGYGMMTLESIQIDKSKNRIILHK